MIVTTGAASRPKEALPTHSDVGHWIESRVPQRRDFLPAGDSSSQGALQELRPSDAEVSRTHNDEIRFRDLSLMRPRRYRFLQKADRPTTLEPWRSAQK